MGFDPLLGMSRWAGLLFEGVVRGQQTAALSGGAGFTGEREGEDCLEPVFDLFRISTIKASTTICRLVLSFLSQFFQSRRHFSSQAKDRSTTVRDPRPAAAETMGVHMLGDQRCQHLPELVGDLERAGGGIGLGGWASTHRFGSTTKVCSSLRFTTSTAAPNRLCTAVAKGFPV